LVTIIIIEIRTIIIHGVTTVEILEGIKIIMVADLTTVEISVLILTGIASLTAETISLIGKDIPIVVAERCSRNMIGLKDYKM